VHVGRSSDLRANGAGAAILLASLPSSQRSQCCVTRSFPITAAGQSRTHTGFPLVTPEVQANRRSAEHSTSDGWLLSRCSRASVKASTDIGDPPLSCGQMLHRAFIPRAAT
jgi:hypothetical protein